MKPKTAFFDYNGKHVAAIGKIGSSALARAILFALQPDYNVVSASGNADMIERVMHNPGWQALAPKTFNPVNPAIPVRDPVERFRSACAQEGTTAAEALARIEAGKVSFHFKPATDYLVTDSTLYKFPEHINELSEWLDIDGIPEVNTSDSNNGPKPELTAEELSKVEEIYASDRLLYDSINEAGQSWDMPIPEPDPLPVPSSVTPRQFRIAMIDAGIMPDDITAALSAIEDPIERAKALTEWEYATVIKRDHPMVESLGAQLGKDLVEVNALFRLAHTL